MHRVHAKPLVVGALTLLIATAARPSAAQPARLVKDIDTTTNGASSSPGGLLEVGGAVYFSATDEDHGTELWKTDGTASGTAIVADIAPGRGSSSPTGLTEMAGTLFFFADDGTHGPALWRSDGTAAGTRLVKAVAGLPFADGRMRVAGKNLFFQDAKGTTIWRSDGTAGGTTLAASLPTALPTSTLVMPAALGDALLYVLQDATTETMHLWSTLGTPASTVLLRTFTPPAAGYGWAAYTLTTVGTTVFFGAVDAGQRGLWKTDGTPQGTVAVLASWAPADFGPSYFGALGGAVVFGAGPQPGCGCEGTLWTSDGSASGTNVIADVTVLSASLAPPFFATDGNRFFFEGRSSVGSGLWTTDGTPQGTVFLKETGTASPNIETIVGASGRVFFSGSGLWVSDGTPSGTRTIASCGPASITALGAGALFSCSDPIHGNEPWHSDGTAAGTAMLRDLAVQGFSSSPAFLTDGAGTLYFTADDGVHGREPWTSDGTASGTSLVADLTPGADDSAFDWIAPIGSSVVMARRTPGKVELWKAGAKGASTIASLSASDGSTATLLATTATALYFRVPVGTSGGDQVFTTDGTSATQVAGVDPSAYLGTSDGTFAYLYGAGSTLSRTDGTASGTTKIDVPDATSVMYAVAAGKTLFFTTSPMASGGDELWAVDRTATSPTRVGDFGAQAAVWGSLAALGTDVIGAAAAVPTNPAGPTSLWKSDGKTIEVFASLPGQVLALGGTLPPSLPPSVAAAGGKLYYCVGDGDPSAKPAALWVTDGTAKGTHAVSTEPDSLAQPSSGCIAPVALADGRIVFGWGASASEPWISDGTEAGTHQLQDIFPGPGSSSAGNFTRSGKLLFFTANDGPHGTELWVLPPASTPGGTPPSPTTPSQAGCACATPGTLAAPPRIALAAIAALALALRRRRRCAPCGRARRSLGKRYGASV